MARYCELTVTYKGKDISRDISSNLLSCTFTDNEQGKVDDIEIILENKKGLWHSSHFPEKSSVIDVGLKLYDWNKLGEVIKISWGKFTIDELTFSSSGSFSIKAISEKCASSFNKELRCRTFENVTLKDICSSIASENNMKLVWKAKKNVKYDKVYQLYYTDSSFIFGECDKAGSKCKIHDDKIFIYDESTGSANITLTPKDMSSYEFKSKTFGTYSACEVRYFNAETGEVVTYREEDSNVKNDAVLVVEQEVKSSEDAKRIAKSELKKANEKEITASINIMGNPNIWVGYEIELKEFGVFSGKYIVDKVSHNISSSQGYVTSFEAFMKR